MEVLWRALPLVLVLAGNYIGFKFSKIGSVVRVVGFLVPLKLITFTDYFVDALVLSTAIIGSVNTVYTHIYSYLKYKTRSLPILVDFFNLSIILVFTSGDLFELITLWFVAELIGLFLIAYDYIVAGNKFAHQASTKYLVFCMLPSHISWLTIFALTGFTSACEFPLRAIKPSLENPALMLIVVLGFLAKAAVFPLHFWLPDAHSIAPSPASALLSGLAVKMGIYALYLTTHYSINRDIAVTTMLIFGSISAIYGALQAIVQSDIKRILAYSTISNTGFLVVLMALYILSNDVVFLEAAILYTIAHAIYKAALFLDSGFVETLTHRRNVNELGFVSLICPQESASAILAVLSIIGLPPSIGFIAEVFVFTSITKYLLTLWIYPVVLVVLSLKEALSIIYNVNYLRAHIGTRLYQLPVNLTALALSPLVLSLTLSSYLISPCLAFLDYKGYVEFALMKKELSIMYLLVAFLAVVYVTLVKSLKEQRLKASEQIV